MLIASYAKMCLNVSVYVWVSGIADVSEQVPSLLIPTIHSEDMLRTGCIKKVCEKTRVGETTLVFLIFFFIFAFQPIPFPCSYTDIPNQGNSVCKVQFGKAKYI